MIRVYPCDPWLIFPTVVDRCIFTTTSPHHLVAQTLQLLQIFLEIE